METYTTLHKNQTAISSEFFVAAELTRRNFNVTLTFGNTKAIDLIIEKDGKPILIQVKGIQRKKSICWNINRDSIRQDVFYVLVNIHGDTLDQPEFFIWSSEELRNELKQVESKRDYIDYGTIANSGYKSAWSKIG